VSLHQQLLDRLGNFQAVDYEEEMAAQERALRTVLELHAPTRFGGRAWCVPCCREQPCPEVQAIARELGIEATDHG
jgi:hypothetical protein